MFVRGGGDSGLSFARGFTAASKPCVAGSF